MWKLFFLPTSGSLVIHQQECNYKLRYTYWIIHGFLSLQSYSASPCIINH